MSPLSDYAKIAPQNSNPDYYMVFVDDREVAEVSSLSGVVAAVKEYRSQGVVTIQPMPKIEMVELINAMIQG